MKKMATNGFAWVNRDGYRLKIVAPYLPGEGEFVHALVRNGNRVTQEVIVGKDAGGRLRTYDTPRRGDPKMVLATIDERHTIHGVANDGKWSEDPQDVYPGFPRVRLEARTSE